jgi:dTDP-4-dehydrorhamnose reductase
MRVLVTGRDGQVGREIAGRQAAGLELVMAGRAECDLSQPEAIRRLVRSTAPEVIVNAAAYTAVDQAEKERDLCFAVNAAAPGILAEEAARLGALLVHYSTDYVFDGCKTEPYVETDPVHPLGVYGRSKAAGEQAVAAAGGRWLVLRTSWVYAAQGKNFLRTMLRLAQERPELRVVDDQSGSPTSAAAIAAATERLVRQYGARSCSVPSGIYHMTAGGSTTWCGFARAIFAAAAGPQPLLIPIATADYPTPAKRPANSVLSNQKFERAFGFRLPPWPQQLAEVLAVIQ